jgi:ABC-2 type transport system permease protein
VAVTIVSLLFHPLNIHSLWVMFTMIILTAILFSLAGLINGVFAKSFDDISIIPTFVLTPLTYLGGVFYSINMLPEFWQQLSLANPILYMVNAFRYGFLGISDISLVTSYAISVAFIVILYLYSLHLLRKGHGIRS